MLSQSSQRELGRLEQTFSGRELSSHGQQWDSLWKDSFTPWDRGGPSIALHDLVSEHPELFPPARQDSPRKRALVPGCGRGYDVLLLSALGYDAYGLDYSAEAIRKAVGSHDKVGGEQMYQAAGGAQKGVVRWLVGDFFADGFLHEAGVESFDLIFDYTFFCALPPDARPRWAKRMSQLLSPRDGRLVCLEWPLGKPPSTNGPPWGVTPEVYASHLSRPGEQVLHAEDGSPAQQGAESPAPDALKRLARIKPARTHKAGIDESGSVFDFISVWSH